MASNPTYGLYYTNMQGLHVNGAYITGVDTGVYASNIRGAVFENIRIDGSGRQNNARPIATGIGTSLVAAIVTKAAGF